VKHMTPHSKFRGFTIVELLIVVVVIAILAAITIVAYTGIQQRARVATVSSDLESAAKQLAMDQVTTNAYPATVALANSGAGLKASPGTTYQYAVNNTSSPQTFCITATNDTTSYFISSTNNVPTTGACAGHGVGGVVAVTNLVVNPAATSTNTSEWLARYSMPLSWVSSASDGPTPGISTYARFTSNSTLTGGGRGVDHRGNLDLGSAPFAPCWPITVGEKVTISIYVRSSQANTGAGLRVRAHDGAGNWLTNSILATPINYSTPNQWIRLTYIYTPTVTGCLYASTRFDQNVTWAIGATIDATGFMLTKTDSAPNYADGSSSNWVWDGAANNSTSTGPPL